MKVERPEEVLPVGSVIEVEGEGDDLFLITGYAAIVTEDIKLLYDYIGCLYPDGVLGTDGVLLFNHEDIIQVFHVGYMDEGFKEYSDEIVELLKSKDREIEEENKLNEMPQERTSVFSKLRRKKGGVK